MIGAVEHQGAHTPTSNHAWHFHLHYLLQIYFSLFSKVLVSFNFSSWNRRSWKNLSHYFPVVCKEDNFLQFLGEGGRHLASIFMVCNISNHLIDLLQLQALLIFLLENFYQKRLNLLFLLIRQLDLCQSGQLVVVIF